MKLKKILDENRSALVRRWFEPLIDTYPPDTSSFLKKEKNPFSNPVGASIRDGLDGILAALIDGLETGLDRDRLVAALDRIIRIRALQKFQPSASLAFVPLLKQLARKVVPRGEAGPDMDEELALFDARVEEVLMTAFDVFADCREKLHDIRVKDEYRRLHMLLRRANLLVEQPDSSADIPDSPVPVTNHEER